MSDREWCLESAKRSIKEGDYSQAGNQYEQAGEWEKAGDMWMRHIELNREKISYLYQDLERVADNYAKANCISKARKALELLLKEQMWHSANYEKLFRTSELTSFIENVKTYAPERLAELLSDHGYDDYALKICEVRGYVELEAKILEKMGELKKAADKYLQSKKWGSYEKAIELYSKSKQWEEVIKLIIKNRASDPDKYWINRDIIEAYFKEEAYEEAEKYALGLISKTLDNSESIIETITSLYISKELFDRVSTWVDRVCEIVDSKYNGKYDWKWNPFNKMKREYIKYGREDEVIYFAKKLGMSVWAYDLGRYLDELEIDLDQNKKIVFIYSVYGYLNNDEDRMRGIEMIKKTGRLEELVEYMK